MFNANFNDFLLKITPTQKSWVIICSTTYYRVMYPLTTKNIKAYIPDKSHIRVKINSLKEFGQLLTLWKIEDPIKQVTRILFQDAELLRFSLKST